jgi:hypothetical protein
MECLIRLVLIPIIAGGTITGHLWTYRSDCKGRRVAAVPCSQTKLSGQKAR